MTERILHRSITEPVGRLLHPQSVWNTERFLNALKDKLAVDDKALEPWKISAPPIR